MEQIVLALKPMFDAIHSEISGLRSEMSDFRSEVNRRFDDNEADSNRIRLVLTDVVHDVRVLKTDMAQVKARLEETATKSDLGELKDRIAFHGDTLLKHDERLRRLEERRA